MRITRLSRAVVIAAALLTLGSALTIGRGGPPVAGAQAPTGSMCPGGPQPITTSYTDLTGFVGTTPIISPFGLIGTSIPIGETVTTTLNVAGVQGLTQTVARGGVGIEGFGSSTVSLGVPEYLLQAYGGNIEAIKRDLAAGLLRCRTQ